MTNLKKIIDKAVSGGYVCNQRDGYMLKCRCKVEDHCPHFELIIFSHDFLKTFFGDFPLYQKFDNRNMMTSDTIQDKNWFHWQYHAQQLVLSEDRIKYLMGFV